MQRPWGNARLRVELGILRCLRARDGMRPGRWVLLVFSLPGDA